MFKMKYGKHYNVLQHCTCHSDTIMSWRQTIYEVKKQNMYRKKLTIRDGLGVLCRIDQCKDKVGSGTGKLIDTPHTIARLFIEVF